MLLPATVVAAISSLRYLKAGPRMRAVGFGISAPVTVGEEFHVGVPLPTRGGAVELVDVRPVGVSGPVTIDTRLTVPGPSGRQLGSVRGPLTRDDAIALPQSSVRGVVASTDGPPTMYTVDVRMIATAPGTSMFTAFEVTYRAGFLRQRTARFNVSVCLHASSDWTTDRVTDRACGHAGG